MSMLHQLILVYTMTSGLVTLVAYATHVPRALPELFAVLITAQTAANTQTSEVDTNPKAPTYPNSETERLEIYVGAWSVTERHYNTKGEEIGVVKGSEDIVWVLDRHAIGRTYTTTHGDELYRATATVKWVPGEKRYRGVWFDSNPNSGPSPVTADWNDADKTMLWKLEVQPPGGAKEEYNIVEKFFDGDRREAVTYRVDKTGVTRTLVVQYRRTVPCPGKVRMFFGD
jgi:hypothetical protein